MLLNLIVGDYSMDLDVPTEYLDNKNPIYEKINTDMSAGWQMGREWVDKPNQYQRCQIAASKLLDALETSNQTLALMTAGYIASHFPKVRSVRIDTSGDMSGTEFTEHRPD